VLFANGVQSAAPLPSTPLSKAHWLGAALSRRKTPKFTISEPSRDACVTGGGGGEHGGLKRCSTCLPAIRGHRNRSRRSAQLGNSSLVTPISTLAPRREQQQRLVLRLPAEPGDGLVIAVRIESGLQCPDSTLGPVLWKLFRSVASGVFSMNPTPKVGVGNAEDDVVCS